MESSPLFTTKSKGPPAAPGLNSIFQLPSEWETHGITFPLNERLTVVFAKAVPNMQFFAFCCKTIPDE